MANRIAVQLLIGRNCEPFLPYALRSVDWADYFTVVNTDPTGEFGAENREIVQSELAGRELRYAELTPDKDGHFSFAEARNKCIELTDNEDFIFIVDSDDVHFPQFQQIMREVQASDSIDTLTAHFFHLMVYKNIYQYVQPRKIIYKNYAGTHWEKGVHELLHNHEYHPVSSTYHYLHYGYVKPQYEVFKRWKFYSDLEGDYNHYEGYDPNNILTDRISVCKPLPVEPPDVIKDYIRDMPEYPLDKLRSSPPQTGAEPEETIGLVMLVCAGDEEYLDACFSTLARTELKDPINMTLLVLDCNADQDTRIKLQKWLDKMPFEVEEVRSDEYISLAEALNYGFDHFRQQERFKYVGWIHPDMEFIQETWLYNLWQELQKHEDWGKVSAANFRDMVPETAHIGHEQCYILRKDILHKIGLFDEGYIGIGGYEDWDLNRRILLHSGPAGSYKVMITPTAWCFHKGMGTRSKKDTTPEQIANSRYYHKKWGTYAPAV